MGSGFLLEGSASFPLGASDLRLLASPDWLALDRASNLVVSVPACKDEQLGELAEEVSSLLDRAGHRSAAVLEGPAAPATWGEADLLARIDESLGLEPAPKAVYQATGRWAQLRGADLDGVVVLWGRGLATLRAAELLGRLVHVCRDLPAAPSGLVLLSDAPADPSRREVLMPVPTLWGGTTERLGTREAWERYLARRCYWELGGRVSEQDEGQPLLSLRSLHGQEVPQDEIEARLDAWAESVARPPIAPALVDRLLSRRVPSAEVHRDDSLRSLWTAGALWVTPGGRQLEITASAARVWSRDGRLPEASRVALARWSIRCPPVAADAATRILRIEDRLRRWLAGRVGPALGLDLHGARLAELEDERVRVLTEDRSAQRLRFDAEAQRPIDVATLRDMARTVRSARLGTAELVETLEDVWRARNNVMHGRTPTWAAVRSIERAEELLDTTTSR